MKAIKTPKYKHSNNGTPYEHLGNKDERKEARKFVKSLRHKLLLNIPLSEVEKSIVEEFNITKDYKLDTNYDVIVYREFKNYDNERWVNEDEIYNSKN